MLKGTYMFSFSFVFSVTGTGPSSNVANPVFYMSNPKTKNMALVGHVLVTLEASESTTCNIYCWLKPECKSFNFNRATKTCELNTAKASDSFADLTPKNGFNYYHPAGTSVHVVPQN